MRCITLDHETDFDGWRDAVRPLIAARIPCEGLGWRVGNVATDLFSTTGDTDLFKVSDHRQYPVRITKTQMAMCKRVLCHRSPERLFHLYATLLRLQSDPHALDDPLFTSGLWVREADKNIRRDVHKMHAFVRFKKVGERLVGNVTRENFCAWFEPDHRIVEHTADFFARRFTGMDWSILTPDGCTHWDGKNITVSPGVDKSMAPDADDTEEAWKAYYASIFNPSRVKIGAMMAEMPKKYWKNLPEAELIPQLIQQSEAMSRQFMSTPETAPNIRTEKVAPEVYAQTTAPINISTLAEAEDAARRCTQCNLHCNATQTVFGQGPMSAKLMLVGEQPGDQEDIAGAPFVGPAGQLLDRALNEAGLDRGGLYVTNAVKHFKFEPRGKMRLHRNPVADEIERCRSWLTLERQFVKPKVILAMGKTALLSLTGHKGTLKSVRGGSFEGEFGETIIPTVHPSFLLRLPDPAAREREYAQFVRDISRAEKLAKEAA